MTFQRCSGCRRHVRGAETRCPFCGASLGLIAAWQVVALTTVLAGGCSDRGPGHDEAGGGGTGDSSSMGSASADTGASSAADTITSAEVGPSSVDSGGVEAGTLDTGDTTDTSPTSAGFIYGAPSDVGAAIECDVWLQDCPRGEKCVPWASDGGNTWNATRCSPVATDPVGVGEPCTLEGSPYSGIDDCAAGSLCWNTPADSLMGECVAQCGGSEVAPECGDGLGCLVSNGGVLSVCTATCDPLAPNCSDGMVCAPSGLALLCVPLADAPGGQHGDACVSINECAPGLFCAYSDNVAGCDADGCCTEFCDLTLPSQGQCSAFADGESCTPFFERGAVPPGGEDLGACTLP